MRDSATSPGTIRYRVSYRRDGVHRAHMYRCEHSARRALSTLIRMDRVTDIGIIMVPAGQGE